MPTASFKHSYKTKTRESLPMAIYNSGVSQCEAGYTWGPGVRDHFLVHHVISGRGSYCAEGVTYQLQPGDTFLIYPSTVVSYRADRREPWKYCWVGFGGAEARILAAKTPFTKEKPVTRCADPAGVQEAITAIYEASGATAASQLRALGKLYLFLALLTEQSPPEAANTDLSLEYVENAIRFIAYNFSHPIDILDVASSVGISRSHLYRVFMRHLHISPNDYLIHFRVSQAAALLKETGLSISAVAASVGYEDSLYFSRVFKKVMGSPPSAYLKQKQAAGSMRL